MWARNYITTYSMRLKHMGNYIIARNIFFHLFLKNKYFSIGRLYNRAD